MPLLTIYHVAALQYLQLAFPCEHRIIMRLREAFDQHPLSARHVARDTSACLPVSYGWH